VVCKRLIRRGRRGLSSQLNDALCRTREIHPFGRGEWFTTGESAWRAGGAMLSRKAGRTALGCGRRRPPHAVRLPPAVATVSRSARLEPLQPPRGDASSLLLIQPPTAMRVGAATLNRGQAGRRVFVRPARSILLRERASHPSRIALANVVCPTPRFAARERRTSRSSLRRRNAICSVRGGRISTSRSTKSFANSSRL
jgi:hypothetical protein